MKSKTAGFFLLFFIGLFLIFRFIIYNPVLESTTQTIEVMNKDKHTSEQWIVLSNEKHIY